MVLKTHCWERPGTPALHCTRVSVCQRPWPTHSYMFWLAPSVTIRADVLCWQFSLQAVCLLWIYATRHLFHADAMDLAFSSVLLKQKGFVSSYHLLPYLLVAINYSRLLYLWPCADQCYFVDTFKVTKALQVCKPASASVFLGDLQIAIQLFIPWSSPFQGYTAAIFLYRFILSPLLVSLSVGLSKSEWKMVNNISGSPVLWHTTWPRDH